ncbi:Uu.00g130430.m01.CDS01 [Anthostomella pinea]|uniref:Uu.00g130430.m01.CDS01 n=1 Tax=Anthostomella pinea TaxID=933095 RepID=A0AAI8VJT5_9PEZI|nr:Uu.00g130430.m01.CDS01 [Anthostomella pinea]
MSQVRHQNISWDPAFSGDPAFPWDLFDADPDDRRNPDFWNLIPDDPTMSLDGAPNTAASDSWNAIDDLSDLFNDECSMEMDEPSDLFNDHPSLDEMDSDERVWELFLEEWTTPTAHPHRSRNNPINLTIALEREHTLEPRDQVPEAPPYDRQATLRIQRVEVDMDDEAYTFYINRRHWACDDLDIDGLLAREGLRQEDVDPSISATLWEVREFLSVHVRVNGEGETLEFRFEGGRENEDVVGKFVGFDPIEERDLLVSCEDMKQLIRHPNQILIVTW